MKEGNNVDKDAIKKYTEKILLDFFQNHNWQAALSAFHPEHFCYIPAGLASSITSHELLEKELKSFSIQYKKTVLKDLKTEVQVNTDEYIVVAVVFCLQIDDSVYGKYYKSLRRISIVFVPYKNTYKVVNYHIAKPSHDFDTDGYIPQSINSDSYALMQQKLVEKKKQMELIIHNTAGGIRSSYCDDEFTIFYVNKQLYKILGYNYKEFMQMCNGNVRGMIHRPDAGKTIAQMKKSLEMTGAYNSQYGVRKKDGSMLWMMDIGKKIKNANNQTIISSIINDITPLHTALEQLRIEKNTNDILFELSNEVIFQYDVKKDEILLKYKNNKNKNINKKIYIKNLEELKLYKFSEESIQRLQDQVNIIKEQTFLTRPIIDFTIYQMAEGKALWWQVRGIGMLNFEHKVISVIGKLINITDNVCLKEKSNKDALTGLYNREFLMNAINNIVKKAKKYYALAVFDIDHFKTINDLLGHPIGDQALILIAKVVEKIVSDKIISARIGGDEFAIFFSGINDQNDIAKKMNELMHKIKREGYRQNISLNLSISIGVSSLYKEKIINFSELYRQADIALYQAKNSGRNCQVFYK